jgi:hypothetical protein
MISGAEVAGKASSANVATIRPARHQGADQPAVLFEAQSYRLSHLQSSRGPQFLQSLNPLVRLAEASQEIDNNDDNRCCGLGRPGSNCKLAYAQFLGVRWTNHQLTVTDPGSAGHQSPGHVAKMAGLHAGFAQRCARSDLEEVRNIRVMGDRRQSQLKGGCGPGYSEGESQSSNSV